MLNTLLNHPVSIALVTMLLMWCDYLLTLAQEKERKKYYSKHYQSYPVNTIEGNPAFYEAVERLKLFSPRHTAAMLIIGVAVPLSLFYIPESLRLVFLAYAWGLFLIVITQHLSNLLGYRISRKGVHGKLLMHQRTGLMIQSARYLSLAVFLLVLSVLSESQVLYGVTVAGFTSSLRLFVLSRKITPVEKDDIPPIETVTDPGSSDKED
ncbi:MAG: hypothetical protein GXO69_01075 [Acidobacteria bacterium]|nr:hypothetical protein [Acidobacteriota bacterium]